jgi:hypothetical protein
LAAADGLFHGGRVGCRLLRKWVGKFRTELETVAGIRSAVRDCMVESELHKRFPLTEQIFEDAPQNEWPSDFAEAHQRGTEGQSAPP